MKTKILLSLGAIGMALLGLVSFKNHDAAIKAEIAMEAISRWENLDDAEVLDALRNEEGVFLSQVSVGKSDIDAVLNSLKTPLVNFFLGVDVSGSAGLFLDGHLQTAPTYQQESGDSELLSSELVTNSDKSQFFDLPHAAKEHLIDPEIAAEMIDRWKKASDQIKAQSFVTIHGQRLERLAFNKEVFESINSEDNIDRFSLQLGLNQQNKLRLVVLGLDDRGRILGNNRLVFDYSKPCPPVCDPPNQRR